MDGSSFSVLEKHLNLIHVKIQTSNFVYCCFCLTFCTIWKASKPVGSNQHDRMIHIFTITGFDSLFWTPCCLYWVVWRWICLCWACAVTEHCSKGQILSSHVWMQHQNLQCPFINCSVSKSDGFQRLWRCIVVDPKIAMCILKLGDIIFPYLWPFLSLLTHLSLVKWLSCVFSCKLTC